MTLLALSIVSAFVLTFAFYERRLWGTSRTPFAFVAAPLLGVLILAEALGPALGYYEVQARTVVALGFYLVLVALASLAMSGVRSASPGPTIESLGPRLSEGEPERGISAIEYSVVALAIAVLFVPELMSGSAIEKGELGVGTFRSHVVQVGMAYLVLALSQKRGALLIRIVLSVLVLWILAFNQVKYLIFLPLAAAVLFRWTSGQLATRTVALIGLTIPLGVVIVTYSFFGIAVANAGPQLSPELALELGRHMFSYVLSGVTGLDRLFEEGGLGFIGEDGLAYPFAPFANIVRFVMGAPEYFSVVNELYLPIDQAGSLTTNVFTLFGSLLYRGGWFTATTLSLGYFAVTYGIWERWRAAHGPVACAAGSWWLAPLLFTWHDPFFMHLSVLEVWAFLWLRARVPAP